MNIYIEIKLLICIRTGDHLKMFEQLDSIDQKIIEMLLEDCRVSNAEISRHVHLSRVAVKDRIRRLMQRGIIDEFTIILRGNSLGYNVNAFFEIEVKPDKLEQVAQKLAELDVVTVVYHMSGPTSLHVHAFLKDTNHLANFMHENIYSIPGVLKVSSQLLLKRYKSFLSIR